MAAYFPLADGTITTSDVAAITVPAGEVWVIQAIELFQPAAAVAKDLSFGKGTTATAANIKLGVSFAAGRQSTIIYPLMALAAGATFNLVASAGTTECTYSISGFKQKTV